jgi:CBS domain-containing protein
MNRQMSEIVRNRKPVNVGPEATVQEACAVMHEKRIGAVLVERDGELVGIFIGRGAVRCLAGNADHRTTRLSEVMTPGPCCMEGRATAIEGLRVMRDGGFRHVPVVENGRAVGIVSTGDFRGLEHDRLDEETGLWERI